MFLDAPRGFRRPEAVRERLELLSIRDSPLTAWSAGLVARRAFKQPGFMLPHIDPADAGERAQVLILLEAPGPMTNAGNGRPGSGFVSSDNDDPTAENLWHLRHESGLDESKVMIWNIVPWYLGAASRKPTADELRQGAVELRRVLGLLPDLQVVLLAGLHAQRGWAQHVAPRVDDRITAIETWHPSPLSLKQAGKREGLQRAFARASRLIG